MNRTLVLTLAVLGAANIATASRNHDRWPVREQETIQKTFTLSEPPMRVVVDNIEGYVHVRATTGSQVRFTAHKSIRAETDSDLRQAKDDVRLEITEKPGTLSIYYDAPWRCNGENNPCRDHGRHFYSVSYDIDMEVPRDARVVLSTVNNGDINLEGTRGDFDVTGINGGITMSDIGGSGRVHTINGPVTVRFAKNPAAPCDFKTLNGQLDVYFQPGLSADLGFKTFNGEIYSDFDVTPRPVAEVATAERKGGRFVYRSNRLAAARVGSGGPELKFDAFNGNIRLHQAGK